MPAPSGMNPVIYEAMALTGENQAYSPDDPETPIPIVDQTGQEQQMDPAALVAEGMAFAGHYMAKNGPTQARHVGKARQMTKGQLEEQKMNEKQGYPSNLDEAAKVKELENKVVNIEAGIGQILDRLGKVYIEEDMEFVPPGQSSPVSPASNVSTGGSPEFPAAPPTQIQAPLATVPQPSPVSTDSSESNEPENKPPKLRQVTLRDGRRISVPATTPPATPMSLGPATDQAQPPQQMEVEDFTNNSDDWDDPIAVVPEPEQDESRDDPKKVEADRTLARTQQLVQDVNAFMQANDVHRFWRRHVSRSLHRHVGYNGWPKELQDEFNNRFHGFLQDPQFVTSVCRKIISMELGHALGVKWVVSFLVATAGFTAFALCGLDG